MCGWFRYIGRGPQEAQLNQSIYIEITAALTADRTCSGINLLAMQGAVEHKIQSWVATQDDETIDCLRRVRGGPVFPTMAKLMLYLGGDRIATCTPSEKIIRQSSCRTSGNRQVSAVA